MTGQRSMIVATARSWIGTPYIHQMSKRGAGCDCLGLIRGVWRTVLGREPEVPPAYTADWSEAGRQELLWQAATRHLSEAPPDMHRPGDVILFRMRDQGVAKHLGVSTHKDGFPSFIHAYSGHGVVESSLSQPWARRIVARFSFPEESN